MRRTEPFNGLAFFNDNFKFDIKMLLTSDFARMTLIAAITAIGLYIIQFVNIVG